MLWSGPAAGSWCHTSVVQYKKEKVKPQDHPHFRNRKCNATNGYNKAAWVFWVCLFYRLVALSNSLSDWLKSVGALIEDKNVKNLYQLQKLQVWKFFYVLQKWQNVWHVFYVWQNDVCILCMTKYKINSG